MSLLFKIKKLIRKQYFSLKNPCCLKCDSLQINETGFCSNCFEISVADITFLKVRKLEINDDVYEVNYLIDWIPEQSDSLSDLVYLLKTFETESSWRYYSQAFAILNDKFTAFCHIKSAIIPIPSHQFNYNSFHTKYFSKAISEQCSIQIYDCLKIKNLGHQQKNLNSYLRRQIELSLHEDFTRKIADLQQVIIVDDIITTGSTLAAAIDVLSFYLKKDCQITILTLFSRGKI